MCTIRFADRMGALGGGVAVRSNIGACDADLSLFGTRLTRPLMPAGCHQRSQAWHRTGKRKPDRRQGGVSATALSSQLPAAAAAAAAAACSSSKPRATRTQHNHSHPLHHQNVPRLHIATFGYTSVTERLPSQHTGPLSPVFSASTTYPTPTTSSIASRMVLFNIRSPAVPAKRTKGKVRLAVKSAKVVSRSPAGSL